jgi:GNAT superfamily N-acetyltransferase
VLSSLTIREYRDEDEDAVLHLLRVALGAGRTFDRTPTFWRWKHFQNPFGPSLLTVARNQEVCGLRALLRWRFRAGGRLVQAVRAVDTATHPAHRRHGVFSALTRQTLERARQEGVDLVFNTPNAISLRGYVKLGWTLVGRPSVLVRPVRPLRMVQAVVRGAATGDGERPVGRPAMPVGAWLHHGVERLLEADDGLHAARIRTDRSVAFLRWRYASLPAPTYFVCWLGAPHALEAAAIFRQGRRRGMREVLVSEVLLRGSPAAVPVLVRQVLAATDADYLVAFAPPGTVHRRGLLRAGFVPLPRGPYFTVLPLTAGGAALQPTRLARWFLSLGDLELF